MLLVWTNVSWISVEAFSHLEDSCCLSILSPEVLGYLWDGVDSDSIELKVLDQLVDPTLELIANPIVLLLEIGKTSEPAVLDLTLVAPVVDGAVIMIMICAVEWVHLTPVVAWNWCHVVGNNINHNIHSFSMGSSNQALQIVVGTKVVIGLSPIFGPVSMITICPVVDDGRNPDCIKSHAFDVVEMVLDALPGTTTIVAEISACTSSSIVLSEPVREYLIDGS